MSLQPNEAIFLEGALERASDYLLHPPGESDPVISLASPDELVAEFASSVGLPLAAEMAGAEPGYLLTAVEQIIEYSMILSLIHI